MFDGDYTINGKHATYIKYLAKDKDKETNNTVRVFNRYIDVYMCGAIVGALNKRTSNADRSSSDRARIYADAFNHEYSKCKEIFKTVILCDTTQNWSAEEKANICFRYRDRADDMATPPVQPEEISKMKEAMDLFNSYVFGGIEILYDIFSQQGGVDDMETVERAFKYLKNQKAYIESLSGNIDDADFFEPEY